jgi:phage host-nuclease inhibitor protein Gam
MALPALKLEAENPVEERVARLEVNVEHILLDVGDIKIDIRRLNDKGDTVEQRLTDKIDAVDKRLSDKIDAVDKKLSDKIDAVDKKLSDKIDAVDQKLTGKFDSLKDTVAALTLRVETGFADMKASRAMDRVWWLLMCAAMLGVMAHGFKWL